MLKWLQIIGLGVLTWGVAVAWLELNVILMSPLVISVVVVLAVALPAYNLGRFVGLRKYDYYMRRDPTSQLPKTTSGLWSQQHHPTGTYSVATTRLQGRHSHPTQPMPVAVSR